MSPFVPLVWKNIKVLKTKPSRLTNYSVGWFALSVLVCDSMPTYNSYPNMIGFPGGPIVTVQMLNTEPLKRIGLIVRLFLTKIFTKI